MQHEHRHAGVVTHRRARTAAMTNLLGPPFHAQTTTEACVRPCRLDPRRAVQRTGPCSCSSPSHGLPLASTTPAGVTSIQSQSPRLALLLPTSKMRPHGRSRDASDCDANGHVPYYDDPDFTARLSAEIEWSSPPLPLASCALRRRRRQAGWIRRAD